MIGLLVSAGCGCFTAQSGYKVVGRVLDAASGKAIPVSIGGRGLFVDGERIETIPQLFDPNPRIPPNSKGDFALNIVVREEQACALIGGIPLTQLSTVSLVRPDQVLILVIREECREEILIDITPDTVVDVAFPDNTIELREPILLQPCP